MLHLRLRGAFRSSERRSGCASLSFWASSLSADRLADCEKEARCAHLAGCGPATSGLLVARRSIVLVEAIIGAVPRKLRASIQVVK